MNDSNNQVSQRVYTYPEERLHGCAKPIKFTKQNGCWRCISHFKNDRQNGNEYVCIQRKSKPIALHRHIWQLANGRFIRPGEMIKHTCSDPYCINPNHLRLEKKNRTSGYLKRKLRMSQARDIRRAYSEGLTQEALAVRYQVSKGTIGNIVNNRTYIDDPPGEE